CCDRQGEHYNEKPHYSFLLGKKREGREAARTENTRLGYRQPTNRAWLKAQGLFDRCQDGRTLVLNQHAEKLRRVCLAGVATDNVNVVRTFLEGLTRVKGDRLLPLCIMTEPSST